MKDRRKLEQQDLAFFARMFDRDTGRMLGNLANITEEGVMLIADEAIEVGRLFRIHMELDEAILHQKYLDFEARCQWCESDPLSPQFYNAGFQFSQIDPHDLEIIQSIARRYRLHG